MGSQSQTGAQDQAATQQTVVPSGTGSKGKKKKKKEPPLEEWSLPSSLFAVLLVCNLVAITWYLWALPTNLFEQGKKVISTLGSWVGSITTFLGIRHTVFKNTPLSEVFAGVGVRLGILIVSAAVWAFVLPFHIANLRVIEQATRKPIDGVHIDIDQEHRGETSPDGTFRINSLLASSHSVNLSKTGYKNWFGVLKFMDVLLLRPVTETLQKTQGKLRVTSNPDGASIYLDPDENNKEGTNVGLTEKILTLDTGEHRLKLKKASYKDMEWESVAVEPDSTGSFNRNLTGIPQPSYRVVVVTDPPGARIIVDGDDHGLSNKDFNLQAGRHRLQLQHDGYKTLKDVVTISRHDQLLTYSLAPQ